MADFLSSEYWNLRYTEENTGWDLGMISPPIKAYLDQLTDTSIQILIPGCGFGHEGIYLFQKGFRNVHFLDFSHLPLQRIFEICPEIPKGNLHSEDFFKHNGVYDLILEQTMFCAIEPKLRTHYALKVSGMLKPGGKLAGVLFDRDFDGGPPFGGSSSEYKELFKPYFSELKIEPCLNSVAPRLGTEVFIEFIK